MKKIDYRATIESIRHASLRGDISYEEAKARVQPLLDEMNAKGEKIAKEYGKRYKKLTFGYVFR